MIGNTIFDTKDFATRLDKEFKWDKAHKNECGWDDHDITMIAEGMLQATQVINKMQLEAYMEKKEYKEVIHAHWIEDGQRATCSNCKEAANSDSLYGGYYASTYCPYCGAIMDEAV